MFETMENFINCWYFLIVDTFIFRMYRYFTFRAFIVNL